MSDIESIILGILGEADNIKPEVIEYTKEILDERGHRAKIIMLRLRSDCEYSESCKCSDISNICCLLYTSPSPRDS